MKLPASLAPLRHRPFALLWGGAFVSNIGTWMEAVGVGILVTETTGQAGWTGLVAAASFAPAAVIGPIGGALADRLPRRRLLLATSSVQAGLAALLAVLTFSGTPSPGLVTLIVLCAGGVQALGFPSYQAMLPDLVPEEDLVGAVALSSAQWNLGRVIGPALAGVVIAAGSYSWAFTINAASFIAVIVVLVLIRLPPPARHDGTGILRAIGDGLGYVRRDPTISRVVAYMALNSLLAAPFIALIPAMAITVLHSGAGGTSALVTAQGIGAVAMALSLGILAAKFGSARVLSAVLWILPISLIAYALAPNLPASALALIVVGFFYLGALSSFMSIAQLRSPPELRGRVMSVLMTLLGLVYPLGALVQGELADRLGLRAVTAGAAILMVIVLAGARIVFGDLATTADGSDLLAAGEIPSIDQPELGEPPW
ncbi:MAG TPA: MFS transporter [Acidimicrobiia bacterium]|nr:MFS transporter [Acidimicrobiia bacterium]